MWKKINESNDAITEEVIYSELEDVYKRLENIQDSLNRSTNIELRKKYMRKIADFMNWLDYEI